MQEKNPPHCEVCKIENTTSMLKLENDYYLCGRCYMSKKIYNAEIPYIYSYAPRDLSERTFVVTAGDVKTFISAKKTKKGLKVKQVTEDTANKKAKAAVASSWIIIAGIEVPYVIQRLTEEGFYNGQLIEIIRLKELA